MAVLERGVNSREEICGAEDEEDHQVTQEASEEGLGLLRIDDRLWIPASVSGDDEVVDMIPDWEGCRSISRYRRQFHRFRMEKNCRDCCDTVNCVLVVG